MAVDCRELPPATDALGSLRLGPERVEDVVDLYGNASRSYFTARRAGPRDLILRVHGRTLVAAAGTHVRSAELGIAAVATSSHRLATETRDRDDLHLCRDRGGLRAAR